MEFTAFVTLTKTTRLRLDIVNSSKQAGGKKCTAPENPEWSKVGQYRNSFQVKALSAKEEWIQSLTGTATDKLAQKTKTKVPTSESLTKLDKSNSPCTSKVVFDRTSQSRSFKEKSRKDMQFAKSSCSPARKIYSAYLDRHKSIKTNTREPSSCPSLSRKKKSSHGGLLKQNSLKENAFLKSSRASVMNIHSVALDQSKSSVTKTRSPASCPFHSQNETGKSKYLEIHFNSSLAEPNIELTDNNNILKETSIHFSNSGEWKLSDTPSFFENIQKCIDQDFVFYTQNKEIISGIVKNAIQSAAKEFSGSECAGNGFEIDKVFFDDKLSNRNKCIGAQHKEEHKTDPDVFDIDNLLSRSCTSPTDNDSADLSISSTTIADQHVERIVDCVRNEMIDLYVDGKYNSFSEMTQSNEKMKEASPELSTLTSSSNIESVPEYIESVCSDESRKNETQKVNYELEENYARRSESFHIDIYSLRSENEFYMMAEEMFVKESVPIRKPDSLSENITEDKFEENDIACKPKYTDNICDICKGDLIIKYEPIEQDSMEDYLISKNDINMGDVNDSKGSYVDNLSQVIQYGTNVLTGSAHACDKMEDIGSVKSLDFDAKYGQAIKEEQTPKISLTTNMDRELDILKDSDVDSNGYLCNRILPSIGEEIDLLEPKIIETSERTTTPERVESWNDVSNVAIEERVNCEKPLELLKVEHECAAPVAELDRKQKDDTVLESTLTENLADHMEKMIENTGSGPSSIETTSVHLSHQSIELIDEGSDKLINNTTTAAFPDENKEQSNCVFGVEGSSTVNEKFSGDKAVSSELETGHHNATSLGNVVFGAESVLSESETGLDNESNAVSNMAIEERPNCEIPLEILEVEQGCAAPVAELHKKQSDDTVSKSTLTENIAEHMEKITENTSSGPSSIETTSMQLSHQSIVLINEGSYESTNNTTTESIPDESNQEQSNCADGVEGSSAVKVNLCEEVVLLSTSETRLNNTKSLGKVLNEDEPLSSESETGLDNTPSLEEALFEDESVLSESETGHHNATSLDEMLSEDEPVSSESETRHHNASSPDEVLSDDESGLSESEYGRQNATSLEEMLFDDKPVLSASKTRFYNDTSVSSESVSSESETWHHNATSLEEVLSEDEPVLSESQSGRQNATSLKDVVSKDDSVPNESETGHHNSTSLRNVLFNDESVLSESESGRQNGNETLLKNDLGKVQFDEEPVLIKSQTDYNNATFLEAELFDEDFDNIGEAQYIQSYFDEDDEDKLERKNELRSKKKYYVSVFD